MAIIASETPAPTLTLFLFGPMQVLVHGRPLPPLRSRKALWLLVLLTLRHGRPIDREWLAGTLWPEMEPSRGLTNLRVVLSEMRHVLGDQKERLRSPGRHTLLLNLEGAEVDLVTFDAAILSQQPEALERAVVLYRGPLLEDCAEEWVAQERRIREQECVQALQILAAAALAGEDSQAAIGYYRRAVNLDPWNEPARRGWMEALAGSGDRNAAMQVYREYRELLRSDPNAVPDDETSALYARLRAETRRSSRVPVAITEQEAEVKAATPGVCGYLPHPLSDLIGREDERVDVAVRLRETRLVTLTGPGGIGKTRLAIEVAGDIAQERTAYPDGVWLVSLESISEERLVVAQIASVLGVKEERQRPLLESVIDPLRTKRLLLVMDNCEHLLEASAEVVSRLLRECGQVRVLATSRTALGITGEAAWHVPALTTPNPKHLPQGSATLLRVLMGYESVQLFVERARACQQGFALTANNAMAVVQVCAQLEGMPLAIEFAAARVRSMAVEQILLYLNDYLGLLRGGDRSAPARQQTLRATLDWSHALLSEPEQILLRRLSVFAGGWTLEAAELTCCDGDALATLPPPLSRDQQNQEADTGEVPRTAAFLIQEKAVIELLSTLVEKSLVVFEDRVGRARYRLLEVVRQFAAERLQAGEEPSSFRTRHRNRMILFAEKADSQLDRPEQDLWLTRMETEHDNIRTALTWTESDPEGAEIGLRFLGVLWRFWERRGYSGEGLQYLKRALARPAAQKSTPARVRALNAAGAMAQRLGDLAASRTFNLEALRIARETGDVAAIAPALTNAGVAAWRQGDYVEATLLLEESLALYREMDQGSNAITLSSLGTVYLLQNNYLKARALLMESLELARQQGARRNLAFALHTLGGVEYALHERLSAQALFEESLAIFRDLQDSYGTAISLGNLADLARTQGNFTKAQSLFEETLALFQQVGDRSGIAFTYEHLGELAALQGDYAASFAHIAAGRALFQELNDRNGMAVSLGNEANTAFLQGDYPAARLLLMECLLRWKELENRQRIAETFESLAAVGLMQTETLRAVRLWGAAAALREGIEVPLLPHKREEMERRIAQARSILDEAAFAAAWAEGAALSWEQAVASALIEESSEVSSSPPFENTRG